jgi:hypothetical protein
MVLMADGTRRAIETIKAGDSVLSRDMSSGRLVPDLVLGSDATRALSTVILELSNGTTLEMTARQRLILHDGALARAGDIAGWKLIRLRSFAGEVQVVSSRVAKVPRMVYSLNTQSKRNIFMRDIQVDPIEKD